MTILIMIVETDAGNINRVYWEIYDKGAIKGKS